jgi:hypothetical protein
MRNLLGSGSDGLTGEQVPDADAMGPSSRTDAH